MFSRRPTHFLALPLNSHSTLRNRISNFQNGLLNATPPITGLDRSIAIDPRRLHLTLGVMALNEDNPTLETALDLLRSLQPSIAVLLQGRDSVKVRLNSLDILKPDRDRTNAHVLFAGPSTLNDEDGARLEAVCNLVNKAFINAGFITDKRPLKLHCTILNTTYRRPRSPMPFSYTDILGSTAYQKALTDDFFGVYDVKRIELWEMGSRGPNNEYVRCGGIDLLT